MRHFDFEEINTLKEAVAKFMLVVAMEETFKKAANRNQPLKKFLLQIWKKVGTLLVRRSLKKGMVLRQITCYASHQFVHQRFGGFLSWS